MMNKLNQYQNFIFACLIIMIINLFVQITFGIIGIQTYVFSKFSWLVLVLIIIAWIGSNIHYGKLRAYRAGYWRGRMEVMQEYDKRISKIEETYKSKKIKSSGSFKKKVPRRKTTSKTIRRSK